MVRQLLVNKMRTTIQITCFTYRYITFIVDRRGIERTAHIDGTKTYCIMPLCPIFARVAQRLNIPNIKCI